jgi:hypothetical protein
VNGWFILLAFVFLGILIASNVSHARNYSKLMEKSLEKALIKNNFVADYFYLSDDFLSGIAINKSENLIAIYKRNQINENFTPTLLNFKDIVECAIQEDSEIVTHTSKSSAISNAMAGGVLFGGIGATVGGLIGEKIGHEKIYKATLSIVVDDLDNPIHEIHFLNSQILVDRKSEIYKKIYVDLNKWYQTIRVIIRRNETELNSKTV